MSSVVIKVETNYASPGRGGGLNRGFTVYDVS